MHSYVLQIFLGGIWNFWRGNFPPPEVPRINPAVCYCMLKRCSALPSMSPFARFDAHVKSLLATGLRLVRNVAIPLMSLIPVPNSSETETFYSLCAGPRFSNSLWRKKSISRPLDVESEHIKRDRRRRDENVRRPLMRRVNSARAAPP